MSRNISISTGGSGLGLAGTLGVVFIILKLCGIIDWPWIWVLAPFWIGFALFVLIMIIVAVIIACIK